MAADTINLPTTVERGYCIVLIYCDRAPRRVIAVTRTVRRTRARGVVTGRCDRRSRGAAGRSVCTCVIISSRAKSVRENKKKKKKPIVTDGSRRVQRVGNHYRVITIYCCHLISISSGRPSPVILSTYIYTYIYMYNSGPR